MLEPTEELAATGPLVGYRVIEMGSIGPVPFAAMLLADMGADVIRLDRTSAFVPDAPPPKSNVLLRGRRNIAVDVKAPGGRDLLLSLVAEADALLEGFRPGVMERLGVGPDECAAINPRLVYGRMTGWGQDGPLAQAAGHDLNYIALAGALAHFGRSEERPTSSLNLVGDYGGGALYLAFGVVCALLESRNSGRGQVVDAAMVDGVASMMSMWWGFSQGGRFDEHNRGGHYFDSGAHFFEVYKCADGEYITVAAIESQFYDVLLERLGLGADDRFQNRMEPDRWSMLKALFAELFVAQPSSYWCALLEGTDACFAPVLRLAEAAAHPHNVHRQTFVDAHGIRQPAPAPRFSRSVPALRRPPAAIGQHTRAVLTDWGIPAPRIAELFMSGAIRDGAGD